jgi:hypothetical protein
MFPPIVLPCGARGPATGPGAADHPRSEENEVMKRTGAALLLVAIVLAGCPEDGPPPVKPRPGEGSARAATFGDDVEFLEKHTDAIVLGRGDAQVAVVPQYQGRVMTSTAEGAEGLSFGWINRDLIASGKPIPQFNPFGGEDRFWLGPEGSQFALYFKPGSKPGEDGKFQFKDWEVPACIDTDPWEVVKQGETSAHFRRKISLTNLAGTQFDLVADRIVRILHPDDVQKHFRIRIPARAKAVAFESDNTIKNTGEKPWTKETGLLSIWILCMFTPSPSMTVVIPYVEGPEAELGPIVTPYPGFGEIPPERLKTTGGVIYFKCDGKRRGKIGLNPRRAKTVAGSYDSANRVLTLATYTTHEGVTDYVNSAWKIQKEPFKGDVVNSYNDGPVDGGKPLGPFYEIESSSPAAALKPGETMQHVHRTLHLTGLEGDLQIVAKTALGVGLDEIMAAFRQPPE